MIDEFNDFLSDWSKRKVGEEYFDKIFQVDGIPLSWFYRPILYSSLLPRPLPSARDILETRSKSYFSRKLFPRILSSALKNSIKAKPWLLSKKTFPSSPREKILFLTFTNHIYFSGEGETVENIPKLEKVIAKIKSDDRYEPYILAADPLSSFSLPKLQQCSHTPYQYHSKEISLACTRKSRELSALWKKIPVEIKDGWMKYKNKELWASVRPNLDFLYSEQFLFVVLYYFEIFQRIIAEENVRSIVLTGQNNIFEKCMIAAAKKMNIPVMIIQHGIGMGTFKTVDVIHNELFAVWGECFKESLLKLGLKEKNIVVTGNLAFDQIEEVADSRQHNQTHKHVLVTTGCYIEDRFMEKETYFKIMRKVIGDLNQLEGKIIIKLHPREKYMEEYRKIIGDNPRFTVIRDTGKEEYNRLLTQSSIIITFGSSILLEAIALGKRTMIIDPFSSDSPLPLLYPHIGSTPCRRWDEELVPTFKFLLQHQHEPVAEDLQRLLYKIDGLAYQRVVREIYKMTEK